MKSTALNTTLVFSDYPGNCLIKVSESGAQTGIRPFPDIWKMFGIDNPEIGLYVPGIFRKCAPAQGSRGIGDRDCGLTDRWGDVFPKRKSLPPERPVQLSCRKRWRAALSCAGAVQIIFRSEVEKIIVDEKGVRGIRLKDGRSIIRIPGIIISTIDIKLTMENLVGLDIVTRTK